MSDTDLSAGIKACFDEWHQSCDFCRHQEGRHYCLFHGKGMRDMDITRCPEWQARDEEETPTGGEQP